MSEEETAVMTYSLNQTPVTNVTGGTCGQVSSSAHICFMLLCSLVFLVGLILNGFTMKAYFCQAQQQASSSVTVYLKNLAAADFLLCLCLPLRIAHYASNSPRFQQFYCHFGASAFFLNMYASILFMGYIAANRYLKIVRPFENKILQTVRTAHIVSMVTWVLLLAMTGTYISVGLLTPKLLTSVPSFLKCSMLHRRQVRVLYKIIHTCCAAIFFSVLFFLVFFYYSTSCRLSQAQQKQPASSSSKKLAESRRKILVLVSVFGFCFIPYHLVYLPFTFLTGSCSLRLGLYYLKETTIMVSVHNLWLDPLIYFIFSKDFRSQFSWSRPTYTGRVSNAQRESEEQRGSSEHQQGGEEDITWHNDGEENQ